MLVGYRRTSTVDQQAGYEAQERDLKAVGVEKMFGEKVSSVAQRAQLEAAIEWCREGDTLIVTKLDRLARSVGHLTEIVARLDAKKVNLRIIALGIDTATPTGRLMVNLLGSIGQFEREIMLERQREGIAKAHREGKYVGRQPTALRQTEKVLALKAEGMSNLDIAKHVGIGKSSVYRIVADHAAEA